MHGREVQGGAGVSSEGPVTIPTSLSLREVSGLRPLHVVTAALMMVMAVSSANSALQQDTGGLRLAWSIFLTRYVLGRPRLMPLTFFSSFWPKACD